MHGGDSLFGRATSTNHVFRDSGVDPELDHKAHRVTEKLSESINTIGNEPSVAFYRIQEHVRKTLPQLVEQKHEVEDVQQRVQGACFDTEYAGNAVKMMQGSIVHFQNIQELLKNAMFMKQQIDYEDARKRQGRPPAPSGRQEEQTGNKVEESASDMADSGLSTDSSLVASSHANNETDTGQYGAESVVEELTGSRVTPGEYNTQTAHKEIAPAAEALLWEDTVAEKDSPPGEDNQQEKYVEHLESTQPVIVTQHLVGAQPNRDILYSEEIQPENDTHHLEDTQSVTEEDIQPVK